MLREIGNFINRLSSRKFLLTVAGIVIVTMYPESAAATCALIATFVGAEGAADAVSRYSVEKTHRAAISNEVDPKDPDTPINTSPAALDDVDKSQIVAGEYPL